MVEWLEKPGNFNIIVGRVSEENARRFGGAQTKNSGFASMREFVYHSCMKEFTDKGLEVPPKYTRKWEPTTCQSRWNSYFKVYKKTKQRLDAQTGFGLTDRHYREGVTLEEAVEEVCPYYYRLDDLFGMRQNIHPYSVFDSHEMTSTASSQNITNSSNYEREEASYSVPAPSLSFALAQEHVDDANATPPSPPPRSGQNLSGLEEGSNSEPNSENQPSQHLNGPDDDNISDPTTENQPSQMVSNLNEFRNNDFHESGSARPAARNPTRLSAREKGIENAQQAKKRDFASTFLEFIEKRLKAESKWRHEELLEAREARRESQDHQAKEREDRKEDRMFRFKEAQLTARKEMFLQLIERGRSEDEALAVIDRVIPLD